MDVYRQAAEIVGIVREGNGTAKALCLRKDMQKKKQTYAVVCETLRHYELLEDVLEVAEFFKYYPQANHEFAMCMAYDVVLGKGVNTHNDSTARAVTQSASYLREAYWQVRKHHVIPPRSNEKLEDEEAAKTEGGARGKRRSGDGASSSHSLQLPRYARVNTLKISVEELVNRLRRSAEARKRARDTEGNSGDAAASSHPQQQSGDKRATRRASLRPHRPLPEFTQDPVVPHLLVFPPGTDLHAHPAVRSGQLILQDRASCLPAAVLLDAVPVEVIEGDKAGSSKGVKKTKGGTALSKAKGRGNETDAAARKPLEYVVDACAAPGNKTTQLAALGAPHIKIMATERDEQRAELLSKRVASLGAADYVNVVSMDFFQLSSDDRAATEGILLDPSCSASGVMTRVDVALQHYHHEQQMPQQCKGKTQQADRRLSSLQGGRHGSHHGDADRNAAEEEGQLDDRDREETTNSGAIDPEAQGNEFSMKEERIEKLARLQRKLLAHSLLSFDNCRTVVYSTCSVHEEENEEVVRQVLDDERVKARGWRLSNIMPNTWKTRGMEREGEGHPLHFTIRCDPATDATNGFYVARFDRVC
ncbi:NOL1/NOP2/sun family [Leishmania donovani]|uniref:NOL1/NOP2/sun_family_putative/Pfam:PF01189 n=1 Tax=Leishmania donovani TaxID=5661 RepID=A0A6J8FF62_LEIDO|nr:NOL1/NOP2/sun family [Leishmania donovani]VDZ46186.1 NOL1/NOP2/sun_family_putative/Pfam:PF01189 [Leishmania donovani]